MKYFLLIILMSLTITSKENRKVLLNEGKDLFKLYDNPRYSDTSDYKPYLMKAIDKFETLYKSEPDNQELNYWLGYAYDRYFNSFSPGEHLSETVLNTTYKISYYFEKVIKINQRYKGEQHILSPYSKITSTWGSLAISYLNSENFKLDSAIWALKEGKSRGGFNDGILEINKNILSSCAKDAILFVNGDNDTFPMWYLQNVLGFRRDVNIINIGLLQADWYPVYISNSAGNNNYIKFSYTKNEIRQLIKEGYQFIDKKNYTFNNSKLNSQISDYSGKVPVIDDEDWKIRGREVDNNNSYLLASDLLVIDIINKNIYDRPLYFSTTVHNEIFDVLNINNYLISDGFALRFLPLPESSKEIKNSISDDRMNILFDNIFGMNKLLSFDNLKTDVVNYDNDYKMFAYNYFQILNSLALHYSMDSKNQSKFETILQYIESLPVEKFVEEPEFYSQMSGYYQLIKNKKNEMKWKKLSNKFKNKK